MVAALLEGCQATQRRIRIGVRAAAGIGIPPKQNARPAPIYSFGCTSKELELA